MFEKISEALDYIENKRIKRTLDQFKETLDKYGFHTAYDNVIHITGTNGKGSTAKYLQLILSNHGFKTGTFTSPYLVKHNDRMCIDGEMIDDLTLLEIINDLLPVIEAEGLSMFEIDLLICLKWFENKGLDFLIFEAGIGGLHDKTNIFDSRISAITNVNFDHQDMLGGSLEEICEQKMGIIRPDSTFLSTEANSELIAMMEQRCHELNTKFIQVDRDIIRIDGQNIGVEFDPEYQRANCALAVSIAKELIGLDLNKSLDAIAKFSLPLHFERIDKFILDGSHNPAGIEALLKSVANLKNVAFVFSALDDKDNAQMLELLNTYPVYVSSFPDFRQKQNKYENFTNTLSKIYQKYDTIILTGSIHFVSYARIYLGEKFHGIINEGAN